MSTPKDSGQIICGILVSKESGICMNIVMESESFMNWVMCAECLHLDLYAHRGKSETARK